MRFDAMTMRMGRRMRSKKQLAFVTLQLLLLCRSYHGFSLHPQQSQRRTPSLLYAKKQQPSEDGPEVEKRQSPNNNNSDSDKNRSFPPLRTRALVSATSIPCFLLAAAQTHAIDLPSVDSLHLGIPNPLPDADPRYFLSGGICAAASHGITTPVDVIKTRQQAAPEQYTGGLVSVARTISKEDGPTALLGGLFPTIIGYGAEGGVKFGLYESLKPEFLRLLQSDTNTVPHLLASLAAGAVASIMLCPMERTRIRLVTDPNFASDGFVSGLTRLVDESGIASLFDGLTAMLSKQVPYTFAKQVSFEMFAATLYAAAANANLAAADVKVEVSFGAALAASILACVLSHPGDVVLTATYKDSSSDSTASSSGSTDSFLDVVAEVYQRKGLAGFFTGLSTRFVQVGVIITSQLVLYDYIKQMLGLPATGAH
jgi:solute carrier family 25 phosphate transporter 3